MRQTKSCFSSDATNLVKRLKLGREKIFDQASFALLSGMVINEEPTTFDQAWNHKYPKIREK
jgi:hypothetical protein